MDERVIWLLLAAALIGVVIFSERTKNRELFRLYGLLYQERNYEKFCRELETVSCIVLFSKAARAYMHLNGAMELGRPKSEIEELFRQIENMKLSKKEREAFVQRKQEHERKDQRDCF